MSTRTARRRQERLTDKRAADGIPPIVRRGIRRELGRDAYHRILGESWTLFFSSFTALYLAFNLLFAWLYTLQPGCIAEAHPGNLLEAFFFSTETMATVGYGVQHPVTLYAHILVTIEILFGLLTVPLATGLIIARFTRPTARVLFTRYAVVHPFEGVPTLMFRAANLRDNQIVEARVNLTLLRYQVTREGRTIRRLLDLPTLRSTNPLFALSWTVMHPIDAASPLYDLDEAQWREEGIEILAVITGIDATTSSTVHARHGYPASHVLFDRSLADIVLPSTDGRLHVDYRLFHDTQPFTPEPFTPEPDPLREPLPS